MVNHGCVCTLLLGVHSLLIFLVLPQSILICLQLLFLVRCIKNVVDVQHHMLSFIIFFCLFPLTVWKTVWEFVGFLAKDGWACFYATCSHMSSSHVVLPLFVLSFLSFYFKCILLNFQCQLKITSCFLLLFFLLNHDCHTQY